MLLELTTVLMVTWRRHTLGCSSSTRSRSRGLGNFILVLYAAGLEQFLDLIQVEVGYVHDVFSTDPFGGVGVVRVRIDVQSTAIL